MAELSLLRYFHAVASAKSITRAARQLRISQPAISKMIRRLEDETRLQLFHREPRGVALTSAGQALFERCRILFQEYKNIDQLLREQSSQATGSLRLGASDNILNYLLPSAIAALHNEHPSWHFHLIAAASQEIKNLLRTDQIECGLFYTPLVPEIDNDLEATEIMKLPFVLIVPKRSPIKKFDLVALSQMTYIGPSAGEMQRAHRSLKLYQRLGIRPAHQVESNNQDTQKRLVQEGVGFAFVAQHMLTKNDPELRVLPTPQPIQAPVYHVRKRYRLQSLPERALIESMKIV